MTPAERAATVAALQEALAALPAAVRALPLEHVDVSSAADGWSAREVVAHLADAEQVYGVRLRMLLTQERPFLAAFDQDAWTRRFGRLEPLDEALGRWSVLRQANLAVFVSLHDEDWTRPGDHEEGMKVGRVETPESVADVLVRHTRQHVEQMNAAVLANIND
jgi:hypothetical protein